MLVKHLINMLYLFQVCGFNKVYHYMSHEFFHVRNKRASWAGILPSARRISGSFRADFAGWMWLSQGWDKIHKIIDDPDKVFLIPAKRPTA